jgi:2,4-dienoyl-CoA reductase (NADPH2)
MEIWNVKAHEKGIAQSVDLVPMGVQEAEEQTGGVVLELQHHPTGTDLQRRCDWVVCSVHQRPDDELWRELAGSPFPVHRVGDCVAPRRAHAAVIEGHRVAVAL